MAGDSCACPGCHVSVAPRGGTCSGGRRIHPGGPTGDPFRHVRFVAAVSMHVLAQPKANRRSTVVIAQECGACRLAAADMD